LVATHTVSEATGEDRRTAAEVATARVHAARADLALRRAAFDVAETNLSHAVIRAPIDGFVIVRNVDPGQTVASVLQTPVLFTVAADLREMRVIAAVDEADIGEVTPGQAATFTVNAYRDRTFQARVDVVRSAPQIVHDVVTYGVELGVDNHDLALKPGMTASVHIATAHADGVLRVPVAALGFTPPDAPQAAGPALWVLDQDLPRRIAVQPGVSDGEVVAVRGPGLAAGARVLVDLTPEGRAAYANPR
jgi:HlyD family secretion protein